jgi:GDPmannose 4,6-dehydratase
MLQQPEGGDYVLATGESHSVREFVEHAAAVIGFDIQWRGEAESTEGVDRNSGRVLVRVDPEFYRPAEVDLLQGDAAKARDKLGWRPEVSFERLVEMMVEADMDRAAAAA